MLIYGLLINFVYTVCHIYISYIRFVVYNRNILNVLLYGLLINFVYTACCIYISYIRFVVYNNTEKRPTEPFCLGDLLGSRMGGSTLGCLGLRLGSWDTRESGIPGNESQNESQTRILGSMGVCDPWDPRNESQTRFRENESQTGVWDNIYTVQIPV